MNVNEIKHVVIQAGGLGSRMGTYTNNRAKCLIPYNGKTIIQHALDFFKDKKIYIICDYKKEQLITYITKILNYDVTFIQTEEKTTSSGLHQFFNLIDDDTPFLITWSDLIYNEKLNFELDHPITVGLTNEFTCRWHVNNNLMIRESSETNGIAGAFFVKNKSFMADFDETKSFVGGNLCKLPPENIGFKYVKNVFEIGTIQHYEKLLDDAPKSRFFNKVEILGDIVEKKCIDSNYNSLIECEINWYKYLNDKLDFIPKLIKENPLTITYIKGHHGFQKEWSYEEKSKIIDSLANNLNTLHNLETIESLHDDMVDIYVNKTIQRVNSIKEIIPFFNDEIININNKKCINPFYNNDLTNLIDRISELYVKEYSVIHGDTTFSNTLFDENCNSYFIDPRGLFGTLKLYGDKNYDWAKLFYSVNGNYDSINSKKFSVEFTDETILLKIKSNGFEMFSDKVIELSGMTKNKMYLHQALIWLSLTGYVKEDIDAILYSFYYGIYLWNLIQD